MKPITPSTHRQRRCSIEGPGCVDPAPEACRKKVVEGLCICHCHRREADLPDPVKGYPALTSKGRPAKGKDGAP